MQTTVVHQLKKFKNATIEAMMICFHLENRQKYADRPFVSSSINQMNMTNSMLKPSSLIL